MWIPIYRTTFIHQEWRMACRWGKGEFRLSRVPSIDDRDVSGVIIMIKYDHLTYPSTVHTLSSSLDSQPRYFVPNLYTTNICILLPTYVMIKSYRYTYLGLLLSTYVLRVRYQYEKCGVVILFPSKKHDTSEVYILPPLLLNEHDLALLQCIREGSICELPSCVPH